jgi:hypothetical protein
MVVSLPTCASACRLFDFILWQPNGDELYPSFCGQGVNSFCQYACSSTAMEVRPAARCNCVGTVHGLSLMHLSRSTSTAHTDSMHDLQNGAQCAPGSRSVTPHKVEFVQTEQGPLKLTPEAAIAVTRSVGA